ncbi:hypothetical protein DPEC_G00127090 [Dallia pectoralis]|uniref:Uncharacterized protein n=1 Tax=Dallia pectoralis TaxID=75939 RepID=A0ACC2GRW5_DALPE|nr:hypothetical protein DPEC_G00127090 [Dallia pectoralis]
MTPEHGSRDTTLTYLNTADNTAPFPTTHQHRSTPEHGRHTQHRLQEHDETQHHPALNTQPSPHPFQHGRHTSTLTVSELSRHNTGPISNRKQTHNTTSFLNTVE